MCVVIMMHLAHYIQVADLLVARPNVAAHLRRVHRHLLVDEFQDTNAVQRRVMDALCLHAGSGRVTVVVRRCRLTPPSG